MISLEKIFSKCGKRWEEETEPVPPLQQEEKGAVLSHFIFNKHMYIGISQHHSIDGPESQKRANRANQLVLFFSAGANFWAILGHFWAILAILGHFWANLGNFGSFLGYFG